jgi:hypothetical protein
VELCEHTEQMVLTLLAWRVECDVVTPSESPFRCFSWGSVLGLSPCSAVMRGPKQRDARAKHGSGRVGTQQCMARDIGLEGTWTNHVHQGGGGIPD